MRLIDDAGCVPKVRDGQMKLSEACIEKGYSKLFNTVLFGDIWWPKYEEQLQSTT